MLSLRNQQLLLLPRIEPLRRLSESLRAASEGLLAHPVVHHGRGDLAAAVRLALLANVLVQLRELLRIQLVRLHGERRAAKGEDRKSVV